MSHFLKHLKGIAKTLGVSTMDEITGDYYKNLFEEEFSRHAETTRHLADAKAELRTMNQALQALQELNKEKSMSNVPQNTPKFNRIDVPVDLGSGVIVTIQGLPGRPTIASCERLCKVIMAYAVAPQASVNPKDVGNEKAPMLNLNAGPKTFQEDTTLELDFATTTFDDLAATVNEPAVQGNAKNIKKDK